jgi:hypothetical protein
MVPGLALVPGIVAFAGGLPIMTADKVHIASFIHGGDGNPKAAFVFVTELGQLFRHFAE